MASRAPEALEGLLEIQTMAPLLWTAVRETGSVLHMERQDRLRWFCGIRSFSEFWFDKTQQAHRLQDLLGRHAVWCAAVIAHGFFQCIPGNGMGPFALVVFQAQIPDPLESYFSFSVPV